ncbi:hypothetical protein CCHR01_08660 [Colletotrichum chrysophilum]|uniref:Uncharacterized protein n=1 Tax=Colletotrichum chrysophilum TaxID=1836956 RepID=A0AAD9EIE8_9PEZI|nr:hypothetical protein CCHR01_08660 [Colletotrichum chrysophilum]
MSSELWTLKFSVGNWMLQQRLGLARALVRKPHSSYSVEPTPNTAMQQTVINGDQALIRRNIYLAETTGSGRRRQYAPRKPFPGNRASIAPSNASNPSLLEACLNP